MTLRRMMVLVLVVVVAFSALPPAFAQDGIESVCLVTDTGRINDGTFNQFAYEGMVRAEDDFDLDTTFIETQSETDYAANIDTCVSEGFEAIITVGFLINNATLEAAAANPDVYFIGVDQVNRSEDDGGALPNFTGIQFSEDQAGFLVGILAGLVTESNVIGGVYGVEIPAVVKFRLGFEQGAAFIGAIEGKEIETLGVYIDSFEAPDRGASAANQFIGDGADVIFGAGGPTGTGGINEAAQQGVWVIGVDQDEYFTTFGAGESPGSEYIISSALKRVDVGVYDMVQLLAEGDFAAFEELVNYSLNIQNGGISFAPKHEADVPDELYERVAEFEAAFADGELETGVDLENLLAEDVNERISTPGAELAEGFMMD